MDAKQLVCAGKPPRSVCFLSRRDLVCAENSENHESVPGAGRGAAKNVSYGRGRGSALAESRRAALRHCKPVLAYAGGITCCCLAGAPGERSEPVGGCTAQRDRVVADADEQRKRRSLAQSDQVAAVTGRKLTCVTSRTAQTLRLRQPLNGAPASRKNFLWRRFRKGAGDARRA